MEYISIVIDGQTAFNTAVSLYQFRHLLVAQQLDGAVELLRDEKMPELIEGYRCVKCGLAIYYDGYIFHLEG